MSDSSQELLNPIVAEELKHEPFCLDRFRFIRHKDDHGSIVRDLKLTDKDKSLLKKVPKFLPESQKGLALPLSHFPEGKRWIAGWIPITEELIFALLTEAPPNATQGTRSSMVDTYYLNTLRQFVLCNMVGKKHDNLLDKASLQKEEHKIAMLDSKDMWSNEEVRAAINIAIKPREVVIKALKTGYYVLLIEIILVVIFLIFKTIL